MTDLVWMAREFVLSPAIGSTDTVNPDYQLRIPRNRLVWPKNATVTS